MARACIACGVFLFCLLVNAQAQDPPQSQVQHDRSFRAQVTLQNWDNGGELSRFVYLNATQIFPAASVVRAGAVRDLPLHLRPEIGNFVIDQQAGKDVTLHQFLTGGEIDGFIIVHRGNIVYEEYPHMTVSQQHLLFSVTKAFVGTALGILETQGKIDMDKPIEQYLPELANSAWAGTHVRDVADMASGMDGAEDSLAAYNDANHKHYQLEASLGWQPLTSAMPDSARSYETYEFLKTFHRVRKAGEAQRYTSANTELLSALLERVTGKTLPQILGEMFWSKISAENDAYFLLNPKGFPIAHAGMGTTLRDLARFGLLFTPSGQSVDDPAIPPAFLKNLLEKKRPELQTDKEPSWFSHSSYQWDGVTKFGQIFKGGFAGQLLFVDCKRDVVIAYFGTNANENWHPTPLPLVHLVETYF